jgi:hypothetical protein
MATMIIMSGYLCDPSRYFKVVGFLDLTFQVAHRANTNMQTIKYKKNDTKRVRGTSSQSWLALPFVVIIRTITNIIEAVKITRKIKTKDQINKINGRKTDDEYTHTNGKKYSTKMWVELFMFPAADVQTMHIFLAQKNSNHPERRTKKH